MDPEILDHYASGYEAGRLDGESLEFARTQEVLLRHLPPAPASVLDVGGGPGRYSGWLAGLGYKVRLVDVTPVHVELATAAGVDAVLGDARALDAADDSADAVLLLGPLYHLTERADRLSALREAARIARPGRLVAAAAVNRFASMLDGFLSGHHADSRFRAIVDQDLADGQHRNPDAVEGWFTTAFFHHPDDLRAEVAEAGLDLVELVGVEGPGWLFPAAAVDLDVRLWAARALEAEPALLGLSSHLLAVARVRSS